MVLPYLVNGELLLKGLELCPGLGVLGTQLRKVRGHVLQRRLALLRLGQARLHRYIPRTACLISCLWISNDVQEGAIMQAW